MRTEAPAAAHPAVLIALNKPYRVQCRFTDAQGRATLADYVERPGVYPAGRLDADSEGLVLLTGDGALQHRLSHPRHKLLKRYLVQVEGEADAAAIARLREGLELDGRPTRAARARRIDEPGGLWPRDPPVRFRKSVPTSWLEIGLIEGRNRQVRRMSAAVGLPTLRLVRIAVGPFELHGLEPGAWREVAVPAWLSGATLTRRR